jgi:fibronectin type 3 domain-containing protein
MAWVGREVAFVAQVWSDRDRTGEWSSPTVLRVIAPLRKPDGLKPEATAQGVKLTWAGPREPAGVVFRIRRQEGKGAVAEVATAAGYEWVDTQTRYGETYEYSVQGLMTADGARAESAQSDPVSIVPVDRFPPAVPAGLMALAGPSSIELSWDPNTEPDFAGYFVYRAASGGALERLAGPLSAPSFSDKGERPGTAYRYAVSAVDLLGNQSERSAPFDIKLP